MWCPLYRNLLPFPFCCKMNVRTHTHTHAPTHHTPTRTHTHNCITHTGGKDVISDALALELLSGWRAVVGTGPTEGMSTEHILLTQMVHNGVEGEEVGECVRVCMCVLEFVCCVVLADSVRAHKAKSA